MPRISQDNRRPNEAANSVLAAKTASQDGTSPHDLKSLVHELSVQQAQLVIQKQDLLRVQHDLAAERRHYRNLFEQAPMAYMILEPPGVVRDLNAAAADLFRRGRSAVVGQRLDGLVVAEDSETCYQHLREALWNEGTSTCTVRIAPEGGDTRWLSLTIAWQQDGALNGGEWRLGLHDVTSEKREARALQESAQRLHRAADEAGFGLYEFDPHSGQVRCSARCRAILGLDPAADAPSLESLLHPDDRAGFAAALERAAAADGTGSFEHTHRIVRADGAVRWVRTAGSVHAAGSGQDRRAALTLGALLDVSAQKSREAHLLTVMSELNHRVKNTLATVEAVADQTLHHTRDFERFRASFRERLRSMSRAHGLLTRRDWKGSALREILEAELAARVSSPQHLRISGGDVVLQSGAALALHMAIHELATNAAKYGSLSSGEGSVSVRWVVTGGDAQRVELHWQERDGPPVRPPRGTGFGSQMLEDVISYELGGEIEQHFHEDGLHCRLSFPLTGIGRFLGPEACGSAAKPVQSARSPGAGHQDETSPQRTTAVPRSRRVLVVEDHAALARVLCRSLEAAGHVVVGPVGTLPEAEKLAGNEDLHAALLDVDLRGVKVFPAADVLRQRGVPFALLTGFDADDLPADHAERKVFSKPVDGEALLTWLEDVTAPMALPDPQPPVAPAPPESTAEQADEFPRE